MKKNTIYKINRALIFHAKYKLYNAKTHICIILEQAINCARTKLVTLSGIMQQRTIRRSVLKAGCPKLIPTINLARN